MIQVFLLLLGLLLPPGAAALTASENAFRLEDSKEGNVALGADEAEISAGEIYNTVVLLWGTLHVHGEVEEVVVLSGKVIFHPTAKLKKTLVVMGGEFESQAGAQVAPQDVIYRAPGPLWRIAQSAANIWRENINWVTKLVGAIFSCLLLWGIGLLLFRVGPNLRNVMVPRLLKDWPKNLIVGWIGAFAVPILFALLLISVLGILLLPFYLLFLLVLGLISYLGAALWAGHRLLPPKPGSNVNPLGFLLGLFAMQLFWAGPWWSTLPVLLLWTLAWGALLRGARQLWK